ncbi:hypothetical protein PHLCEN_2v7480 [Hermanssonia centrifuga]|uniref:Uncharacterized protein n=1 Tax=Hermanssonia centrifuga TaxID=98765 RepID=A0A2R6NWH0_9APHY|nr:hypothetical protein PHLCEN_2v7480 [Hermanssonia centrifuga]
MTPVMKNSDRSKTEVTSDMMHSNEVQSSTVHLQSYPPEIFLEEVLLESFDHNVRDLWRRLEHKASGSEMDSA